MTAPSARGLFRATGKSAEAVPREAHDFYPTPSEVTRAFLAVEGSRLRDFGSVWEPDCGDGVMVRDLSAYGLDVFASDLIDRGHVGAVIRDFYDFDQAQSMAMVTNPPYCEINARDGKGRWLRHALDLGCEYVALFLNWDWPCAAGHSELLARHPISRAYACRWKVDFTGKGAPPQRNGWFIWDTEHSGPTELLFMDRHDGRQGNLFPEVSNA